MNRKKNHRITLFVVLVGLFGVQEMSAQTIEGRAGNWRSVVQHDSDASGAVELLIHNVLGNITVKGAKTSRITVNERLSLNSGTENQARTSAAQSKMEFRRSGSSIELSKGDQASPIRGAWYEITIPETMRVFVDVSSGNMVVSDLQGLVHLDTGSGNVDVKNVLGPLEIRSGAGNVTLDTIRKSSLVNTGGGNVTASATRSSLTVTTGGGNVEISDATGDVSLTTAGGSLTINKIGGNARLFTSGGDISARDVKGSLGASTSGGRIDMANIVGEVDASTSGGSIEGSQFSSWINADTNAGDIRLTGVRNGFNLIAEVGNVYVELEDARFLSAGDASIEGRFGNVTLIVPAAMNGQISALVFESGSIGFKNPGRAVETIRERPSAKGESLRRAIGDRADSTS